MLAAEQRSFKKRGETRSSKKSLLQKQRLRRFGYDTILHLFFFFSHLYVVKWRAQIFWLVVPVKKGPNTNSAAADEQFSNVVISCIGPKMS